MPDRLIGYLMHAASRVPPDARRARRPAHLGARVVAGAHREHASTARPPCSPAISTSAWTRSASTSPSCTPVRACMVITLPGMADDELRRAAARAFNLYNAEMFGPYADRHDARGGDPDAHSRRGHRRARLRDRRARPQGARCSRATCCGRCRSSRKRIPTSRRGALPGLLRHRQPVRLRPGVAQVHRARSGADVPLRSDRLGIAAASVHASPVQPDRWLRRGRRSAREGVVLRWRDSSVPAAALRLPRGRRHLGPEPLLPHARALGEAQRRRDRAPSTRAARHRAVRRDYRQVRAPEGAGDPRPGRAGLAVVRLSRSARRLVGVRSAPRERRSAELFTGRSTSGARATTAWWRRRSTNGSIRSARA